MIKVGMLSMKTIMEIIRCLQCIITAREFQIDNYIAKGLGKSTKRRMIYISSFAAPVVLFLNKLLAKRIFEDQRRLPLVCKPDLDGLVLLVETKTKDGKKRRSLGGRNIWQGALRADIEHLLWLMDVDVGSEDAYKKFWQSINIIIDLSEKHKVSLAKLSSVPGVYEEYIRHKTSPDEYYARQMKSLESARKFLEEKAKDFEAYAASDIDDKVETEEVKRLLKSAKRIDKENKKIADLVNRFLQEENHRIWGN